MLMMTPGQDQGNTQLCDDSGPLSSAAPGGSYGQFSKVQSGRRGPAPGRFEPSKGILK